MTTPTTPVDLDAIEALAEAATPGTWTVKDTFSSAGERRWEWVGATRLMADARYIAALSPDVALALVEAARALPAVLSALHYTYRNVPADGSRPHWCRFEGAHDPTCAGMLAIQDMGRAASDALRGAPPATREDRS